jgi:ABC-type multidrug transport system ATPase subunit
VLDEPTRSLDPVSARELRRFLREEIAGRQGCTVLLATHSAEEAFELCDRVGVLDEGRLLAVGAPAELATTVGDDRYVLWTVTPSHPAIAALAARVRGRPPRELAPDPEGWARVEIEVPGGLSGAADALEFLACAGVSLARFEHRRPTLADLIERVVQRAATGDAEGSP